jgi:hypothetical protein
MSDFAWAAGLFEGEGCITYTQKAPVLRMNMTDRDVLERFASVMGSHITGPYTSRTKGGKPFYQWHLGGIRQTQAALRKLWPYLGERRRARAALMITQYYESPVKRRTGSWPS